jgi:hypothetical protein
VDLLTSNTLTALTGACMSGAGEQAAKPAAMAMKKT